MKFKRGDVDPQTGLVYWSKDVTKKGGIRWVRAEDYDRLVERQRHRMRVWSEKNKEKEKARLAAHYLKNKEAANAKNSRNYYRRKTEINAHRKEYRKKNAEAIKRRVARWRDEKREHCRIQKAEYYRKNKGRICKRTTEWQKNNRDKVNANSRRYSKVRRNSDPLFALANRVRGRVADAFRKKAVPKRGKTKDMLGCEWEILKDHIESQFRDGMTWGNRNLWHIDHIVPLASAGTEADLIKLCHYTNLQPMWASENKSKNAKCPVTGVDYRKPPAPKRVKRSTP